MSRLVAVCGPPGAGKSTYVTKRMGWDDLLVDLDAIYCGITGRAQYEKPAVLLEVAKKLRDVLLEEARKRNLRAWYVTSAPKRRERNELRTAGFKVIVIETDQWTCLDRIRKDPRRACLTEEWREIVDRWWRDYEPSNLDEVSS